MKAFLDSRQSEHDPKYFMRSGAIAPNPEQPKRVDILSAGAKDAGCAFVEPTDMGIGHIASIHSPQYLTFLENIHERWTRIPGGGEEVVPNIHPRAREDGYPRSAVGQAGYHQADTACPIAEHTWKSAYWSAQSALNGADFIAKGGPNAYALLRPPGHHAYTDQAGGFCFLNNSAIAAEYLLAKGMRPTILDVDVHHGNGTQGIFYRRDDVLTVSLHADPERFYPFFWGYELEKGEGQGLGYNLNLPLDRGTGDDDFLNALDIGLARARNFGSDVIVVALGLDASIDDPFEGLAITQDGFERIGARIASLGLPCLMVQEGGYISDSLGINLTRFLTGIQN